jgi:membrane protease YdiL (CAAX protease family)
VSDPEATRVPAVLEAALMLSALLLGLLAMVSAGALFLPLGPRVSILAAEAALVLPFLLVAPAARLSPERALALRPVPRRTLLLSVLCGAAFWLASAGLIQAQSSFWPPPPEVAGFIEKLRGELRPEGLLDRAGALATMAVLPGVAEEIAFRGALLTSLARATSGPIAVAVSAGLFGVIHYSPAGYRIPFALGVGVALGILRLRTGSVLPGMIAHAVLNSITLTLSTALDAEGPATAPLAPALALLAFGILLSGLLVRLCAPAGTPVRGVSCTDVKQVQAPAPVDPDPAKN